MDSIRPSLFTRARPLLVTAGIVGAGFAAIRIWSSCERRAHDAESAAGREADARDDALVPQIRSRLAPLRRANNSATLGDPCPSEVTGALALVEKPWLDWFLDDAGRDRMPARDVVLRSPGFAYLTGAWTPAVDSPSTFAQRNAAYRALVEARFIAVLIATAEPIAGSGATFTGGTVAGTLAVGDVTTGRFVCATPVTSSASFVVMVEQSSAEGDRAMRGYAEREAMRTAFWDTAGRELARIAPTATVVRN